ALDELRVTPAKLDALLARYSPGDAIQMLAFRREELKRFDLRLARQPPPRFVLEVDERASAAAQRRRVAWCGGRRRWGGKRSRTSRSRRVRATAGTRWPPKNANNRRTAEAPAVPTAGRGGW